MSKEHSRFSRRTVLKASSILATGGVAATGLGSAQQHSRLEIKQYPVEEYVVITNVDPELEADITGYSINFEAEDDDYNQIRELAGEVVIAAGESITVPTGAREVEADNIVELADPYDGEVLNNDGSDVVTLLDTNGEIVWSTADNTTYTLNLTVIDPEGEPVADARIGVYTYYGGEDVTTGTTDENGQATFELRNGSYEVGAGVEGYATPSEQRFVGIDGADVEHTIQLVRYGSSDPGDGGSDGSGDSGGSDGSDVDDETHDDRQSDGSAGDISSDESGGSDGKDCPAR